MAVLLAAASLSLIIWLYLTFVHHGFWRRREFLPTSADTSSASLPTVISLTPARSEAELIAQSLGSILRQSYKGSFRSVLIDDSSRDNTSQIAQSSAEKSGYSERLHVIEAAELPSNWSGKLWALQTGIETIDGSLNEPVDYYWLSDADISHDPDVLERLVAHAQREELGLVSLMVTLNCKSFWERIVIPAFVYYFQMLYPFASVNNPKHGLAGAAGGCILIRRDVLESIGGFHAIKDKLIDDCELGKAVKAKGYKIWLGHGTESRSLRGSSGLADLWKMVTRTAFVQLNYSYLTLFFAVFGMALIYGVPVFALVFGLFSSNWILTSLGAAAWGLMAVTYWPTLRAYKRNLFESFLMPVTAHLFMGMTLHAAWLHFRGSHSGWHDRVYVSGGKQASENLKSNK